MPQTFNHQVDALASLFMDASRRDLEPAPGQIGESFLSMKSVDEEKRQIHFLCSTDDVDRMGEVVDQSALAASIPSFMFNPVFLANHVRAAMDGSPTVIGHWVKLWVSKDGLEGIVQFDDEDELSLKYWNLYRKRHMRAVSICFIGRGWEMREVKSADGQMRRVRAFTQVDLIEISAVSVPANQAALMRAAFHHDAPHAPAALEAGQDGEGIILSQKSLQRALKDVLKDLFTAGPAEGFTRTLALEIASVLRSPQGHGGDMYLGGFPVDDDVPDPSDEVDDEGESDINTILRAALPSGK